MFGLNFRNRGFNDRLYWLNFKFVWTFVLIGVIVTLLQNVLGITDLTVFSVGIPCAFTELGIHTGFIVWKAQTENMAKHNVKENITM